ncbi:hypothetical protein HUK80_14840 [Flavobacterium sp. MAH-1]|uniref:Uncharacterized protein n=1 Tax=Flavobacterium agri TaxID=2743471 RepID=A0A7Y8Y419_9FLAO|nr:hypothetical protein [Flavobacterium agri]NUY82179.1 hypothetical protein [Flavobacterium agri]NYA72203.1 hypothetical protein [Flavobacterium agri]
MKRTSRIFIAAIFSSIFMMTSCKKETTNVESTEITDTVMTTEPDTTMTQAAPVNDTNVSGTTEGEMEQVP